MLSTFMVHRTKHITNTWPHPKPTIHINAHFLFKKRYDEYSHSDSRTRGGVEKRDKRQLVGPRKWEKGTEAGIGPGGVEQPLPSERGRVLAGGGSGARREEGVTGM